MSSLHWRIQEACLVPTVSAAKRTVAGPVSCQVSLRTLVDMDKDINIEDKFILIVYSIVQSYLEYQSGGWLTQSPLPPWRVCLPLVPKGKWDGGGGGETHSGGWSVGGTQYGRLDRKPGTLSTLWGEASKRLNSSSEFFFLFYLGLCVLLVRLGHEVLYVGSDKGLNVQR